MSGALQGLSGSPERRPHLFVTDDDITSLPSFAHDTLFAVKAPPSAVVEVPEPRVEEHLVQGPVPGWGGLVRQQRYR